MAGAVRIPFLSMRVVRADELVEEGDGIEWQWTCISHLDERVCSLLDPNALAASLRFHHARPTRTGRQINHHTLPKQTHQKRYHQEIHPSSTFSPTYHTSVSAYPLQIPRSNIPRRKPITQPLRRPPIRPHTHTALRPLSRRHKRLTREFRQRAFIICKDVQAG